MCQWSPCSDTLATGSADGVCRLWEMGDMSEQRWASTASDSSVSLSTALLPHCVSAGEKFRDVTSITWSPDGQVLATGCYDGSIRMWTRDGQLLRVLKEHNGPVFSLKFHRSGGKILSGSYDQKAIVWCARSGAVIQSFIVHSAPVLDVDWRSGPGDVFATCSSDKTIQLCVVDDSGQAAAAASADATTAVAVAGAAGVAVSADPGSGDNSSNASLQLPVCTTPTCTLNGHTDEINAIVWCPAHGQRALLASCSDDSTAKIWGYVSDGSGLMELKYNLLGHTKVVFSLKWMPSGLDSANPEQPQQLCTASFDGTVKLWSETGQLCRDVCRQVQPVYSLAPSPNGLYVATGALGGNVSVYSLVTGGLITELQGTGDTFDVSWSMDSKLLSSCFSSGHVYVLQIGGGVSDSGSNSSNGSSDGMGTGSIVTETAPATLS